MANFTVETYPTCRMCDSLIFGKIIQVGTDNKVKLCSQRCFESYSIMIQQIAMKKKPDRKPGKKGV